jgi:hypothetical protein
MLVVQEKRQGLPFCLANKQQFRYFNHWHENNHTNFIFA